MESNDNMVEQDLRCCDNVCSMLCNDSDPEAWVGEVKETVWRKLFQLFNPLFLSNHSRGFQRTGWAPTGGKESFGSSDWTRVINWYESSKKRYAFVAMISSTAPANWGGGP